MRSCYDVLVRTTVELNDDAYQIAKTVAREQHRSIGAVISDFITGQLGGVSPPVKEETEEGYFFPTFRSRRPTTPEDVSAARDDDE